MLACGDGSTVLMFVAGAWALWISRNKLVLGGIINESRDIMRFATSFLADFVEANNVKVPHPRAYVDRASVCWKPPDSSCLKLNVDVAIFSSRGEVGLGEHVAWLGWCGFSLILSVSQSKL